MATKKPKPMTKREKMCRTKGEMEKLKLKAKTKFFQGASLTSISKEIGVSRYTLTRWKKKEKWELEAAEVRHEVDAKIKSQAVNGLFDELAPEFREVANNIRVLNSLVTKKLWKRDNAGHVLRDANGKPMLNDGVDSKDIRNYGMLMATNIKSMRLLAGESTENISQKSTLSGKVDHMHTHEVKGPIDECMEKMASGEISEDVGQAILGNLAKEFQNFREAVNTNGGKNE